MSISIRVNGEVKEVPGGLTLHQLLLDLQVDPSRRGIAIALDREVIPRQEWQNAQIHPGSEVEVIGAVQGG